MRDLSERSAVLKRWHREGVISAVSAGVWLVIVGVIFLLTPNLIGEIIDFFEDIRVTQIPGTVIFAIAPTVPRAHVMVYEAVTTYSMVWGLFQIVVLAFRFVIGSSVDSKARTASSALIGLGTYYLASRFLNELTTIQGWFLFWASLIMLIGASLIVRAIIIVVTRISH